MTILGLDVSHYQTVNWPQVKTSGRAFAVLKATEGTAYVDPTFAANRKNAHAAGLIVGHYHFAKAGSAAAEAAWFLKTVGTVQPGEFLVLDWETAYSGDHVAWCKAWLDAVYAATGIRPLIYMNKSAVTGHNWAPVAANYGLWLASYDGSVALPAVPYWGVPTMKQFSDKGVVPGVSGVCDVDVFYGDANALAAHGKNGASIVATLDADDIRNIANAVWFGAPGASLIPNARLGRGEWAYTTLGALEGRLEREILPPLLQPIVDAVKAAPAAPSVNVDAVAVADALAAHPEAIDKLAEAIAAKIAARLGNG